MHSKPATIAPYSMPSKISPNRCHRLDLQNKPGATQVHAIYNVVSVLADRGDTIVVDEFAYVHVTECILVPKGLKLLPVSDELNQWGLAWKWRGM